MSLPLDGLRVLDLTRVLAGPYASMVLADLGADVLKIEHPEGGDDARGYPPFVAGESAYFMSLNRNKRSMTLNLKSEGGREVFMRLVAEADVLIENFRPGTMEKLGLGYEALAEANPRLIYAASSGFGHTGPYAQRPAYDLIVQGMGGLMSLTGLPGGPPTRVGASIGDITSGLFATIGILTALHHRDRHGRGQKVDVAMLDCQVAILENAIARYAVSGRAPGPTGNRHPAITPFAAFTAADGQLIVACGNDALWRKWCVEVGREDLAADPRFLTNSLRTEHWEALEPIMNQVLSARPVAEWLERFMAAGIPAGPINDVEAVVADPQVRAREMIVTQRHPVAGEVMMAGIPVKLSETPGAIARPAPLLGQHTLEVLEALGYETEAIARLKAEGAVG